MFFLCFLFNIKIIINWNYVKLALFQQKCNNITIGLLEELKLLYYSMQKYFFLNRHSEKRAECARKQATIHNNMGHISHGMLRKHSCENRLM